MVSVFFAALCCYCCMVDRQGLCLAFRNLPWRPLPHHLISHCMPKAVSRVEPLLLPWSSAPLFLMLYLCLVLRRNALVSNFLAEFSGTFRLGIRPSWGNPLFNKWSKRNCSIRLGFLCYQLYLLFILFIRLSIVHPTYDGSVFFLDSCFGVAISPKFQELCEVLEVTVTTSPATTTA